MIDFLLLICGIAGLWLGSEILIKGAMSLADRYRLSDALFGMLVLAIGTDLPELFVAFDASFRSLAGEDLSGIVIGSAVGSTIGQFALVFGIAGFLGYESMQRKYLPRNVFFLVGGHDYFQFRPVSFCGVQIFFSAKFVFLSNALL